MLSSPLAPPIWHFKSKEELIDEMATMLLARAAPNLVPARKQTEWESWGASRSGANRWPRRLYRFCGRLVRSYSTNLIVQGRTGPHSAGSFQSTPITEGIEKEEIERSAAITVTRTLHKPPLQE
jgi:AcrR family transcriptional regulator